MRALTYGCILCLCLVMLIAQSQGGDRVAAARPRVEPLLKEKFRAAGVPYPARKLFIRAFKREGIVELWAQTPQEKDYHLIHGYAVTCASGGPGPKRKQGDRQVPEGCYVINRFNPQSLYHLSLGINYPNASDKKRTTAKDPGGDIFIHGKNVSIGCLPIGDEFIEELYIAATATKPGEIPVHIFPARMDAADWPAWRDQQTADEPELAAFWQELLPIYEAFQKDHRLPAVSIDEAGRYVITRAK